VTLQHMTSAEFRALHGTTQGDVKVSSKKKSKTVRGPWHTRCRSCGEESYTEAAQERHCFNPGHRVYEVVAALSNTLTPTPKEKP
jgi:hypothetical protein